jgi:hypothetical protein
LVLGHPRAFPSEKNFPGLPAEAVRVVCLLSVLFQFSFLVHTELFWVEASNGILSEWFNLFHLTWLADIVWDWEIHVT